MDLGRTTKHTKNTKLWLAAKRHRNPELQTASGASRPRNTRITRERILRALLQNFRRCEPALMEPRRPRRMVCCSPALGSAGILPASKRTGEPRNTRKHETVAGQKKAQKLETPNSKLRTASGASRPRIHADGRGSIGVNRRNLWSKSGSKKAVAVEAVASDAQRHAPPG